MRAYHGFLLLLLGWTAIATADEPPRRAQLLATENLGVAELIGLDAAGELRYRLLNPEDEELKASTGSWVRWGSPAELASAPVIVLVDQSRIVFPTRRATDPLPVLRMEGERLEVEHPTLGGLSIPLEWVRGILWQLPSDRQQQDRWILGDETSSEPVRDDQLWLENGDRVTGRLLAISTAEVQFTTAVGEVKVPMRRAARLEMNPTLLHSPRLPPRRVWVGLSDGSRLLAARATLDQDQWTVVPVDRLAAKGEAWSFARSEVTWLQPLGTGPVYLSDLPVTSYKHVPFLSIEWPYQLDRNVLGTALRAGERSYLKGIGMHSAARLTFRLDRPYRRLEAELAIDDSTRRRGSVICRVFVDSELRFTSGVIRGGEPPQPIDVDLRGGGHVSLIVDYADQGDVLDHINWLDARLVPEP